MFVEIVIVILKVVQHTVYCTVPIIRIERLKTDITQSNVVAFSIWYLYIGNVVLHVPNLYNDFNYIRELLSLFTSFKTSC